MMREGYSITIERGDLNYEELASIYRKHYGEMQERLKGEGIEIGPYRPRLEAYFPNWKLGHLINFVVRFHGKAVGYANIYFTHDMHNGEPIATEDTIYLLPEHRNGMGRELTKFTMAHMKQMGCKRAIVTAVTDTRSGKLCQRLGYRPTGQVLTYIF